MSLNISLLTATSGLRAHQAGIDLVSRNLANANTEGYSAKRLNQETQIVAGQARGVLVGNHYRDVDAYLHRQVVQQKSTTSALEVQESYLTRLDVFFGAPEAETSLAAYVNELQNGFYELQSQPESSALQQQVALDARTLARNLNTMSNEIVNLRQRAEDEIGEMVTLVNQRLYEIGELNRELVTAQSSNKSTADLMDRMDSLLSEVSGYIDISTFRRDSGQIAVSTKNGQPLVEANVYELTFEGQAVVHGSKYTNPTTYPTVAPNLGGIQLNGQDVTASLSGGRIAGLLDLRDNILPTASAQLDEFSIQMSEAFRNEGLELFQDPVNPGGGAALLTTAGVGHALRLEVNEDIINETWRLRDGTAAAAESTTPGDTTLIDTVLANVFESQQTFRTTGLGPGATPDLASGIESSATLLSYSRSIISHQSGLRADILDQIDFERTYLDTLEVELKNDSAVNIDEEMAELIKLEASYSASAKAISTIQEMFDQLLNAV
ncbi:MAG: flagellar hook-associated protein FlgK [Alphaproteobacteria bacterium]